MQKWKRIVFWVLIAMSVVLISLVVVTGITSLVTFLVILYVGLGGFFVGVTLTTNEVALLDRVKWQIKRKG